MPDNRSNNDSSHLDLRTFYLGMLNGLFVILASAFLDPETVLPAFALEVIPGGNVIWVGIICSAINIGWFWPQIFLSRQMDTKQFLRPYYGIAQGLRALCMLLAGVALYFLGVDHPALTFAIVVILLFASSSGGAYGLIMMQGHGRMGVWDVETPTMIRYGQQTNDEFFVSEVAAKEGVTITNPSTCDPLVMLKHFGPDNPDLPEGL